ncbi:MAG: ATP synthase F1 subunit epsilon [Gemmatimonadales bacterium]
MDVLVISPEASVYSGPADSLVVPTSDGEVGILPRHAPYMALLGKGTLTVKQGGKVHRFTVQGGFLQVVSNRVRVVAEQVAPA